MNEATFKRRLIDFFDRHDPANIGLVEVIAEEFQGKEERVFEILNKFYVGKKSGISRDYIQEQLQMDSNVMGPNSGSTPDDAEVS